PSDVLRPRLAEARAHRSLVIRRDPRAHAVVREPVGRREMPDLRADALLDLGAGAAKLRLHLISRHGGEVWVVDGMAAEGYAVARERPDRTPSHQRPRRLGDAAPALGPADEGRRKVDDGTEAVRGHHRPGN